MLQVTHDGPAVDLESGRQFRGGGSRLVRGSKVIDGSFAKAPLQLPTGPGEGRRILRKGRFGTEATGGCRSRGV